MGQFVFWSSVCLVLGFICLKYPLLMWKFAARWETKDGSEPSNLFVWLVRIIGVVVALLGLIGIITAFLNNM